MGAANQPCKIADKEKSCKPTLQLRHHLENSTALTKSSTRTAPTTLPRKKHRQPQPDHTQEGSKPTLQESRQGGGEKPIQRTRAPSGEQRRTTQRPSL
ncbi:hypothetical protein LOK49_Contig275G00004 [Camellia lanceoleosa]|nr:hypothetical protein LOK49_Contig275G00004 [Camellia lanceoleosa]